MAVSIEGMFGGGHTYFSGSPVVITIRGLEWPGTSPFNIVRVEVKYSGHIVGDFRADTGGQSEISFDISSALRSIWSGYEYDGEVGDAQDAADGYTGRHWSRIYREYSLVVSTEYLASDGEYTTTASAEFNGGRCSIGWLTEWERSNIGLAGNADMSYWEGSNLRNGDASTKPTSTPERVGITSITSWVDVSNSGTQGEFFTSDTTPVTDRSSSHAPLVLRDSQPYVDFLFVNRRGAVETCSGQTLEAMSIEVNSVQYSRVERPTFKPSRSLMAVSSGGRRSWEMSSGYVTREWADWWVMEFLMSRQWWMLYQGRYVPVIVKSSKQQTGIYDRSKQQMPHVDFIVTLALEG